MGHLILIYTFIIIINFTVLLTILLSMYDHRIHGIILCSMKIGRLLSTMTLNTVHNVSRRKISREILEISSNIIGSKIMATLSKLI
jgi:uncharacterized membrane protein